MSSNVYNKECTIMAIKMRAVYFGDKKLKSLAEAISDGAEKKADTIPPAYNVEKVRLLFVCVQGKKNFSDTVMRFFSGLDKSRADNVAFIIEGAEGSGATVINAVKEAGANVIDNVLYVKGGLFASASAADIENAKNWAKDVITSITG